MKKEIKQETKKDEENKLREQFLASKPVQEALTKLGDVMDSEGEQGVRFILTELFKNKNVKMMTDLTVEEINVVDRSLVYSSLFSDMGFTESKSILDKFYSELLGLRISKNRLSRLEYIEGFKIEQPQIIQERTSSMNKFR